jgi:type IV secretion system protein VirB1
MIDFLALALACAPWVAPETLSAIVKTESGFQPLAIGINGGARLVHQPRNTPEAVVTARWLIDHGYNIDLGLGQINVANLSRLGMTVEDAFDPCRNLAGAASILHSNYIQAKRRHAGEQQALHAALSAYNTGSFERGFANGYVQRVRRNADRGAGAPLDGADVRPIALVSPAARTRAEPPIRAPRPQWTWRSDGSDRPASAATDDFVMIFRQSPR